MLEAWICSSPDGVERIEDAAFGGGDILTSVTLGSKIRYIGMQAFGECPLLVDINYAGSEADWKNVELYNGAEAIGYASVNFGK